MAPVPLGDPAKVDLKSLRVAFYKSNGVQEPTAEIQSLVSTCVGYFSKLGCKVKEDKPPKMLELSEIRQKFEGADGREHIRALLKKHGTAAVVAWPAAGWGHCEQRRFHAPHRRDGCDSSQQLAWFESYDLIICPASQRAPIPLDYEPPEGREAARRGGGYTSEYNTTGWPAGVVRAGTSTRPIRVCRWGFKWWHSRGATTWCSRPRRISKSRRVGGGRRREDRGCRTGSAR